MTQPAQRAATRAVAALVLLGIIALLVVALTPWPDDSIVPPADNSGLRQRVARECGISPEALYGEQDQGFGVFWWWVDDTGARHRASLTNGVVSCGR